MAETPATPATKNERSHQPWSFYLLRAAGIPIYIHFTLLLMLLFIGVTEISSGRAIFGGLGLVILVFASIVLHELGHALTARRYGIQTEDIVLYPIGGVARLRSLGEGMQEFWIAIAGPAVNIVIAILLFAALKLSGTWIPFEQAITRGPDGAELINQAKLPMLQQLMLINMLLVIFNMIPAFPMDGGRILRALLSRSLPKERATQISAKIGQGLAIVFMIYGLLSGAVMLMLIGIFIFLAAGQESAAVRSLALTAGKKAREAMITHFELLGHGDSLGKAADLLLSTSQKDFPVRAGSEVIGVLGSKALLQGLASHGRDHFVAEIMAREFQRMTPDDDLKAVFEKLREGEGQPVLIFDQDELVGYINQENLMEFLMVEQVRRMASHPDAA